MLSGVRVPPGPPLNIAPSRRHSGFARNPRLPGGFGGYLAELRRQRRRICSRGALIGDSSPSGYSRATPSGPWGQIFARFSGRKAEQSALIIPSTGKRADPFELVRGQADRLPALEDRLDDVRGEEGQGECAADLTRIPVGLPGKAPYRDGSPLRQVVNPALRIGKQLDQFCIRRRGAAGRVVDHELRLDSAPPQLNGDGEIEVPLGMHGRSDPRLGKHLGQTRSLDFDAHRIGSKCDPVQ